MEPVKYNHSKSAVSAYYYCEYNFYKQKILGDTGEMPVVATQGIEMHRYFEMFFSSGVGVDFELLFEMDEDRYFGSDKNEVYSYFITLLYSYIDEQYKNDQKFYLNLRAFAIWNATRWREIKYFFKNKEKCRRYFFPRSVEERIEVTHECTKRKIKGFIDVRFSSPKIENRERIRLTDYKTGRIPKGVRRESNEGISPSQYSKELSTKYVMEGNFYCFMYLIKLGYTIKKDEEGNYQVYDKSGEKKISVGWLEYEYIFTNGDKAYIARKKCNMRSLRSVISKIQTIDKHIEDYENGFRTFCRVPSQYKCPKCQYFLNDCINNIDPIEAEIIKSTMIPEDIEINEDFYMVD